MTPMLPEYTKAVIVVLLMETIVFLLELVICLCEIVYTLSQTLSYKRQPVLNVFTKISKHGGCYQQPRFYLSVATIMTSRNANYVLCALARPNLRVLFAVQWLSPRQIRF